MKRGLLGHNEGGKKRRKYWLEAGKWERSPALVGINLQNSVRRASSPAFLSLAMSG
jgi:hypothetical protein